MEQHLSEQKGQPCQIWGKERQAGGQRPGDGNELGVSEEQKEGVVLGLPCLIMVFMSQFLSLIFRRKCGITQLKSHPTAGRVLKATLKMCSKYLK